jgi:hypothetical protein
VRQFILLISSIVASQWPCATSHADGEELFPGGGAQHVARGGATTARPSDASTLFRNPAGLVELNESQGHYGVDLPFDDMCVDPYGYYGWGVYIQEQREGTESNPAANLSEFGDAASRAYGERRLDRVCNSGPIVPIPQLAVAVKLGDDWSLGFGLFAPILLAGSQWGGKQGTIAADGADGAEARPTPTRYQVIRQSGFGLNLVGGAAYRPASWLSVGMNLQIGVLSAQTYSAVALRAGTSPANDMLAKLDVSDYFIPALTFGLYAKPSSFVRLAATFAWSDDFDGSGELSYTTNTYHKHASGTEALPYANDRVKLGRAVVTIPWTATLAVRIAEPRTGLAETKDLLERDRWDIELDASFTANSALYPNTVSIADDFALEFRRADGMPQMSLNVEQSDLSELSVERHLRDVIGLRLGGGWTAVRGVLQFMLGVSCQSRGVDPAYASVNSFGLARLGLGFGALVRLGPVDLVASYAHIFQETLEVAPPRHEPREEVDSRDPRSGFDQRIYEDGELSGPRRDSRAPSASQADGVAALQQSAIFESETLRARVVNAGRYTASFNVLSLSVVHRY